MFVQYISPASTGLFPSQLDNTNDQGLTFTLENGDSGWTPRRSETKWVSIEIATISSTGRALHGYLKRKRERRAGNEKDF